MIFEKDPSDVSIETIISEPMKVVIPRDPSLISPPMLLQNITSDSIISHSQLFNLHYVNISSPLPISVHIEIDPLNRNNSYLFIYKFDGIPFFNNSFQEFDGWTLFCPGNRNNQSLYSYFFDNEQTLGHQSLIFGLRQLNSKEELNRSSSSMPMIDQSSNFTDNYSYRVYSSGCYYLDFDNHQWRSDGLKVGSLTNLDQTECYSTQMTTLSGSFQILPTPINWRYVFANADFLKNKTIYSMIIIVCVLYIILLIYARHMDRKDLEKLGINPLSDNHWSDEYHYQILVFTGHRKNAGTQSKVHFILYGDQEQTPIRTLNEKSQGKVLQRNGIDGFVMSVPK